MNQQARNKTGRKVKISLKLCMSLKLQHKDQRCGIQKEGILAQGRKPHKQTRRKEQNSVHIRFTSEKAC